jgi:aminoglycoside phosphotransferase (APT) family kinase protein
MEEAIAAAAARELGTSAASLRVALRPASTHQSNTLYDVWRDEQHLIAKEFTTRDPEEGARREFDSLQLLIPLDLAPRPISLIAATEDHGPVVLYEYIEGVMWDRCSPEPGELRKLADAYIKIGELPREGLWVAANADIPLSYREVDFRKTFEGYGHWAKAFPPAHLASELCIRALDRLHPNVVKLAAAWPPLRFCQTDARFANFVQRPNGSLAFIDWEDAGLRDPARQLADLMMHANQEDLVSHAEWASFLDPYYAALKPSDPDLPDRMHTALPLFALFWLGIIIGRNVERLKHGGPADSAVNELDVNLRLRRYLARALAWPDLNFSRRLDQLGDLQFFPVD